jgi:hypothetical protein
VALVITVNVRRSEIDLKKQCGEVRIVFMLRELLAWSLVLLTPCSLMAQETGSVLVHGTGSVSLNGSQLTNSLAVTAGAVIQTGATGLAYLSAPGSSAVIESNSIVRFHTAGLSLDHGSVSVATSKSMTVFARDFTIAPTSGAWTEFYVTRADGAIQIIARKNDVIVSCGTNSATVKEGQQLSRNDAANCGVAEAKRGGGAPHAATRPVMASAAAKYTALGVGGALTVWSLAHGDNPVSPSKP